MFRPRSVLVQFMLCVLLHAPAGWAQTAGASTGAVEGRVLDTTGAVLPGVAVTAAGDPVLVPPTTASDRNGSYRFPTLPPGRYTLTFAIPGFRTEEREGILVSLGATTTVNVTLDPAASHLAVTVVGGAAVVDRRSTMISATFDAGELARLPGARTVSAIQAATPAVQLTRLGVGGSTAFFPGPWSVYGTSGSFLNLEGIPVVGINPPGWSLDYGSVADVSVGAGAFGADIAVPLSHLKFVTKSGGNRYTGSMYAGYEHGAWQGHNIDAGQEERGAPVADGLPARETNRLLQYHDVSGDVGGYLRRNRLWWYGSARDHASSARQVNFTAAPIDTRVTSLTGKVTWRVRDGHQIVGFAHAGRRRQPIRLEGFLRPATTRNTSIESTLDELATSLVWKAEWNASIGRAVYVEARVGESGGSRAERANVSSPRTEDLSLPEVSGGNRDWQEDHRITQANGAITGWLGRHELTAGILLQRRTAVESWRHAYPGDVLHVARNGTPREVFFFQTPSRSESGQWWYGGYVGDKWQIHERATLHFGVRLDGYRIFLPPQEHPAGRFNLTPLFFPAVPNVADWRVAAPRIAASVDLGGDGRTVLKSSYGTYWLQPGVDLGFNVNPNGRVWWERRNWADANRDGEWQPGEEHELLDKRGGESSRDSIDPNLELAYVREATVRVDREAVPGLFVGTGLVWRGERQQGGRQRGSWPFEAFSVPVTLPDPGPDGELGTSDDGAGILLYDLRPDLVGQSGFVVRNASYGDSDWLTWEVVARRRFSGRWSVLASFAHTWNRDHAGAYLGQPVRANEYPATPNDLIHTDARGRHVYRDWSFKVHGTYAGPWGLLVAPYVRHQSGQAFGRTLVRTLSYGTIRVLAEPVGTRRQDHITLVDVRVEKAIHLAGSGRLSGFVEVFNVLNANPEQNISWEGATFLNPLAIVPPRIARVGFRLDW